MNEASIDGSMGADYLEDRFHNAVPADGDEGCAADPTTLPWLEEFFSRPAPRAIPSHLRGRITPPTLQPTVWLTLILILTLGLTVLFFPWGLPAEIAMDFGWVAKADALIEGYGRTNFHQIVRDYGGGDGRRSRGRRVRGTEVPVYKVGFSMDVDGRRVESVNYYTGETRVPGFSQRSYDEDGIPRQPIAVMAEFFPPCPSLARLRGGRLSSSPSWAVFVPIFPFGVWIILAIATRRRRLRHALVTRGMLADAEILRYASTRIEVNDHKQYKVYMRFTHPGGVTEGCVRAYNQEATMLALCYDRERTVRIAYLPEQPQRFRPVLPLCGMVDGGVAWHSIPSMGMDRHTADAGYR